MTAPTKADVLLRELVEAMKRYEQEQCPELHKKRREALWRAIDYLANPPKPAPPATEARSRAALQELADTWRACANEKQPLSAWPSEADRVAMACLSRCATDLETTLQSLTPAAVPAPPASDATLRARLKELVYAWVRDEEGSDTDTIYWRHGVMRECGTKLHDLLRDTRPDPPARERTLIGYRVQDESGRVSPLMTLGKASWMKCQGRDDGSPVTVIRVYRIKRKAGA